MKYKSELIKDIVDTRGHEKSSLHYESECVEKWIEETKGAYPKLCDYESEWLNYINEKPIGNFPYETVTANPTATINNVVPYAYKSAILKGSTKYHDIDTGEFLETFEEGRNLELVSVKMPVLTTSNEDGTKTNILTVNEDVELHGIGDVKDELNLLTGELTQCISKIVFDGSEKWDRFIRGDLSTPAYRTTLSTNSNKQYNTTHIRCNMAEANGYSWSDGEHIWIDNYNNLTIHTDRFNSLEDFKSYINNSNLIVQYTVNESVKTVDLSIQDQDGNTLRKIKPIEGTMHITASGTPINPTVSLEVPVEAITQNLSSFIEEE